MKRSMGYIVLLAGVATVLVLLLSGRNRPGPIGLTMLGWRPAGHLEDTNQYATLEVSNRTTHAYAIGLSVQATTANGGWGPVPEKFVLEQGIANVMFVLPASAGTNVQVKWLPGYGRSWRVTGEYDRVATRLESRFIHWAGRLHLTYPFGGAGQIPPQDMGAPHPVVQPAAELP